MNHKFLKFLFLLISCSLFYISGGATPPPPIPPTIQNLNTTTPSTLHSDSNQTIRSLLSAGLSFIAAAISSAGGLGGGGLFIPILTVVAGLDVKTASTYSAFMVTGGSIVNVGNYLMSRDLIDYDVAALCQPALLLGVSGGVVLNVVLPEWLILVLFVVFVVFCTFKTCKSGVVYWRLESRGLRDGGVGSENGESTKVPLLGAAGELDGGGLESRWRKIGMLVVIWVCFFVLYLLRGNRYGQGIFKIEPCGTGYWIISSMQIPLAIFFTFWILYKGKSPKSNASIPQDNGEVSRSRSSGKLIFPVMALMAGLLGGIFGIGGGMLISPFLLQIGIDPQVTAATCSFMVLVSSSMSALQYLLLGMKQISAALTYAAICFIASVVGLTVIQQVVRKHGRPSMIVFSVGIVMALSVVLMTCFGVMDFLNNYRSGKSMGFNMPC